MSREKLWMFEERIREPEKELKKWNYHQTLLHETNDALSPAISLLVHIHLPKKSSGQFLKTISNTTKISKEK